MLRPSPTRDRSRPHYLPGSPDEAQVVQGMLPGIDVAALSRIDRADGNPAQVKTTAQAGCQHLNLELIALLGAFEQALHQLGAERALA
jgi:hypothetical protein